MSMNDSLNVLAFVRSEQARDDLQQACAGMSGATIDIKVHKLQDVTRRLVNGHDVVLLDFNPRDTAESDRLKHIIKDELRETPVLVSAAGATLADVRHIMSLGVVDVLSIPVRQTDLAVALDHAARRRIQPRSPAKAHGKVITVLKGGGGAGASTVAVQGGCLLASDTKQQARTCLLDLDVQFGTAGLYLDMQSSVGLVDVLETPERLDHALLSGAMTRHGSGLNVLLSPQQMVSLDAVTPEFVAACLRIAREQYDYVLVDIAPSWTNWTYAALSRSDLIILVTQLTVAGIRQSLRQIQTIEANGLTQIPLKLVLNRHDTGWRFGTSAHVKDAETTLGRKFDFVLPNDFKLVSEAINRGVPLSAISKRSSLEKAMRRMYGDLRAELHAEASALEAHVM
jgi:pilus assembly protein CpaE